MPLPVSVPDWLMPFLDAIDCALTFPQKKNSIMKEWLALGLSKHGWCHFALASTLCKLYLLHNEKA